MDHIIMKDHRISLNVENFGVVEFDVSEETFRKFSRYCEQKFPEKNWKLNA